MKVRWTDEALQDRLAIWEYLAERNPIAAVELDERFDELAERLTEHPLLGAIGQIAGPVNWCHTSITGWSTSWTKQEKQCG
ncbi:type II toxin-antitoxin system RelE/ParE family toxin [Cedecea colo]|uniref:type II toxin-antitoxin system RelE/ParE family toxin n=1 Tax=Cedecea colo TaxID=2552946 RepID=UPI003B8337D5